MVHSRSLSSLLTVAVFCVVLLQVNALNWLDDNSDHTEMGNTFTLPLRDARSGSLTITQAIATDERIALTVATAEDPLWQGPPANPMLWRNRTHFYNADELAAIALALHALRTHHVARKGERVPTVADVIDASVKPLCYRAQSPNKLMDGRCDAFVAGRRHRVTYTVPLVTAVLYSCTLQLRRSPSFSGRIRVHVLEDSTQLFYQGELAAKSRQAFLNQLAEQYLQSEGGASLSWSPAFSLMSVEVESTKPIPYIPAPTIVVPNAPRKRLLFRVLSQNIWNFNGNWTGRLALLTDDFTQVLSRPSSPSSLVDATTTQRPTFVTLQEVRYHSDFVPIGESSAIMGRTQSGHFWLEWQRQAAHSSDHHRHRMVSIAFHPSTSYLHLSQFHRKVEMEGLAIAAIISSTNDDQREDKEKEEEEKEEVASVLFSKSIALSRDQEDGDDAPHQRRVLCSAVLLLGTHRVDICTSHFSLSQTAQLRNVDEAVRFMQQFATKKRSLLSHRVGRDDEIPLPVATVFTGDLNAEPDAPLFDRLRLAGYLDLWERSPQSSSNSGFTFNAADRENGLSKRIDYIFMRRWREDCELDALDFSFLGRSAKRNAEDEQENSDAVLEPSSDHLGIAVDISLSVQLL